MTHKEYKELKSFRESGDPIKDIGWDEDSLADEYIELRERYEELISQIMKTLNK